MHCPACNFENPARMKFCGQCGTQLGNRCSQCGFENPPGFQFCGECGTPLTRRSEVRGPKSEVEREAEECFQKAIEIARRQQAKSLELQAVMSLSRLWQQQGKKDEARQMLAETYGWFTEGFDTADLKEAKALLEELS